jgi:hypothetical protein
MYNLMKLASNCEAPSSVRAIAYLKLDELKDYLKKQINSAPSEEYKAQYLWGAEIIDLYQENPEAVKLTEPLPIPQGPPI